MRWLCKIDRSKLGPKCGIHLGHRRRDLGNLANKIPLIPGQANRKSTLQTVADLQPKIGGKLFGFGSGGKSVAVSDDLVGQIDNPALRNIPADPVDDAAIRARRDFVEHRLAQMRCRAVVHLGEIGRYAGLERKAPQD